MLFWIYQPEVFNQEFNKIRPRIMLVFISCCRKFRTLHREFNYAEFTGNYGTEVRILYYITYFYAMSDWYGGVHRILLLPLCSEPQLWFSGSALAEPDAFVVSDSNRLLRSNPLRCPTQGFPAFFCTGSSARNTYISVFVYGEIRVYFLRVVKYFPHPSVLLPSLGKWEIKF